MEINKNFIFKSILAGFLIAIAGVIFLQCPNKIIGSALFAIGLIAVIVLEAKLFTGMIGYIDSKKSIIPILLTLTINLSVAFLIGLAYRYLIDLNCMAMTSRLAKPWYRILADGFGCGILVYLAIELYRKTKSIHPVILCVMAFILAGFEHSIADAFYYGASELTIKGFGYLWLVILGNSLGSLTVRLLQNNLK